MAEMNRSERMTASGVRIAPYPTAPAPPRNKFRFAEAWKAMKVLMADPDDTVQVFKIIRALKGNSGERGFQRFVRTEAGHRILAEKRDLVKTLENRDALRAMPAGSLGRAYAEFADREEISPDGLVEASEAVTREGEELDPDRVRFGTRLRDAHDLWHVVTGYGRDLYGEAALLAFTYRQIREPGIGFIIFVVFLKAGREFPEERRMLIDGYRRAKGSAWLASADWEALLERPLDEVRQILGVVPTPTYEGVRSEGAPALA